MTALPFLRRAITSPLRSAAIGAVGGAAHGAVTSTPEEGRSGVVRGALRGAALGGAVGGLGRAYANTRLLNPGASPLLAAGETAKRLGAGVANFGKRQIHGFTGAYDPNKIGITGRATAAREVDLIERKAQVAAKGLTGAKAKEHAADVARQIESARRQGEYGQRLIDTGATSIPGVAKALSDPKKRGAALRAMGASVTSGGAALAVGLPVAMSAPSLMKGDERAAGGKSVGQKLKGLGLNFATGAMTGGMPIIPQMVAGTGLDYAARKATGG